MNTITCRDCRREAVQREHKGGVVLACPDCEGILYRPIGREPPTQLDDIRP